MSNFFLQNLHLNNAYHNFNLATIRGIAMVIIINIIERLKIHNDKGI